MPRVRFAAVLLAVVALCALPALASARPWSGGGGSYVTVQLLATNDMHGQVTTGRTIDGRAEGGAAYVAAYIDQQRAENPERTLLVDAGDAVGASPPVSGLLLDEPAIAFMNEIGYDVGVLGNHEFDDGVAELLRLHYGGCSPVTEPLLGCFPGASFPVLGANVVWEETGEPLMPPYHTFKVDGIHIGFIGVVTTETPSIVVKGATDGLSFLDEAETINRYVAELRAQHVEVIVVLAHKGGFAETPSSPVTGEIVELANAVDDAVDVIVSGHTHQGYVTEIDGKLVTQAWSYTQGLADIDLVIDRRTQEVVSASAELIETWNDAITPNARVAALVAKYEALVAPLINRQVGTASTAITRDDTTGTGETALGNLITDAQRWKVGADVAFLNPGGIRADLAAGPVTWGDLFATQPFGNELILVDLTGAQIYALLEQQWQQGGTRFLQLSGIEYDYNPSLAAGSRIVEVRAADGTPLDLEASYRVVANAFLANGGDAFSVMEEGTNREVGPNEMDALVEYIEQLSQPFTATIEGRISIVE